MSGDPIENLDAVRELPFPDGGGKFTRREADGVSVVLNSSNEWSRLIGGFFRLHSSRSVCAPASLTWSQVPLSGNSKLLKFSTRLAVAHSKPVYAVLKISGDGKIIDVWSDVVSEEGCCYERLIPPGFELLAIELEAYRFFDLENDDVSVIDIEPILLVGAG